MATPVAALMIGSVAGRSVRSWYAERRPPPSARHVLSCTWSGDAGWARTLRVLPDGCVDVSWDGQTVWVTPALAGPTMVGLGRSGLTVGVRLRPHAAVAVLGRPVPQLDAATPLGDLWPEPVVDALAAGLARAAGSADPADVVAPLVETMVARSVHVAHRPDPGVAELVARLDDATASVAGVARCAGLSERTLRRRLVGDVGLAPKTLQEILRFRSALDAVGSTDIAAVAATAGYYDQGHLTRQFRRFAGSTPARVAARRRPTEG